MVNHYANNGPGVQKFCDLVRSKLGIDGKYEIFPTSSGTAALHLLVEALKAEVDRIEWRVPAYTWRANCQGPLSGAAIDDIRADYPSLRFLEKDSTRSRKNIVVTNLFGTVCDIQRYVNYAREQHIFVIFDNAATPWTQYGGRNALNYGDGSCVSFHHTKPLGFGEGGIALLDRSLTKALAAARDLLANQGPPKSGLNYKMSDIAAAYIACQLNELEDIAVAHMDLYSDLLEMVDSFGSEVTTFRNYADEIPFSNVFPVVFPFELPVPAYINLAEARRYYKPLALHPANANSLYLRTLCFPIHRDMTREDVTLIEGRIRNICQRFSKRKSV